MSTSFAFSLVVPERLLVSTEVSRVHVPGTEGDFDVLTDHAPVMAILRPGIVEVDTADDSLSYYIRGGFADVADNSLTILAEHAFLRADMVGETLTHEQDVARAAHTRAKTPEEVAAADELLALLDTL